MLMLLLLLLLLPPPPPRAAPSAASKRTGRLGHVYIGAPLWSVFQASHSRISAALEKACIRRQDSVQ